MSVFAAAFVFRSALVSLLAPAFLTRAGLQEVSLQMGNIGSSHVEIDFATGILPLPAGDIRVQLEGVAYDFNYRQLLAGKVERFKVAKAELNLPNWEKKPVPDQNDAKEQGDFSLEQLFQLAKKVQALPLEALQVDTLVVHASLFGDTLITPPLLLEYASRAEGGRLLLRQQPAQDLQGETAPLALELDVSSELVQLNVKAEPASLQEWLPLPLPLQRGEVEMQASIDQNDANLRSLQLQIQAKESGGLDWQVDFLQLAVHATSPAGKEQLLFTSDSHLSVQGLKTPGLQLEEARLPLQGQVDIGPGKYQLDWQPQEQLALKGLQFADIRIAAAQAEKISLTALWHRATPQEDKADKADQPQAEIQLGAGTVIHIQQLALPGLQAEAVQFPLEGTMFLSADSYQLDWQPQAALVSQGIRVGETRIATLQGDGLSLQLRMARSETLPRAASAKRERELGHIVLGKSSRLELRQLSSPGWRFDSLGAQIPLQLRLFTTRQELHWRPQDALVVQGLQVGGKAEATAFVPLHFRDIRLQYEGNQGTSRANADFLLAEAGGALRVDWQQRAAGSSQELSVHTPKPLPLNTDSSPLRVLAKPPAALEAVVFEQGQIKADLRLNWGKAPTSARLNVDVQDGLVRHGNMEYQGINLQQRLNLSPQLRSVQAGPVSVQAIKGPIAIEDVSARLQVVPSSVKKGGAAFLISDGRAGIFDGRVETANCRYDPGRSRNACIFSLHGLDLAAILALHKVEGLDVSGRINGQVPVSLNKEGFSVSDGSLINSGDGGVIQYLPSNEALKSSPYSEYVLKALEDYRYHSLNASLTYEPDGTLVAGLELQGRSPKLETSRPVHLNLRAEQNLLSLLKSLQYSQGLTSELNRRVQERFQPEQTKP